MRDLYLRPPITDPDEEGYGIRFESPEWHRRAAVVNAMLEERVAALPEEIRLCPIEELVARDRAPGVGVLALAEMMALMETADTIAASEAEIATEALARELVA
jgi:hypothetical protein